MGRLLQRRSGEVLQRSVQARGLRRMSSALVDLAYPVHLESDVVLRNGRTLRMRPVRTGDGERLRALFASLSPRSLHSRFFATCTAEEALRYAPVEVDYVRDFGLVGEMGGEIVAVAHYFGSPKQPDVAEVAFTIAD